MKKKDVYNNWREFIEGRMIEIAELGDDKEYSNKVIEEVMSFLNKVNPTGRCMKCGKEISVGRQMSRYGSYVIHKGCKCKEGIIINNIFDWDRP